jgi:hypothetical protein
MRLMLIALLALLVPAAAQAQGPLTPGRYRPLPRDSSTINRFRGVEFELLPGGTLLWRRGEVVEQRMQWRASDHLFEVDDALGCGVAPTGQYRVVRWVNGFAFEPVRDGCTMRVAALNGIYLLPKGELAAGND